MVLLGFCGKVNDAAVVPTTLARGCRAIIQHGVAHICNRSTWEMKAACLHQLEPGLCSEFLQTLSQKVKQTSQDCRATGSYVELLMESVLPVRVFVNLNRITGLLLLNVIRHP